MHKRFDHKEIEKKWQDSWRASQLYKVTDNSTKPKAFVLDMFPYPSGEGLHVGHPKGYIATDIYSRFKRMTGHEVLHPMGWDAFGLPAENYAIKHKVHPREAVEKNVARFKEQLEVLGFDYDWDREINTTDPAYYKWTQWIFIQLFKKGLAYESNEPINWCPGCQTGLANEDLEPDGTCERCSSVVEQKPMRQWVLKIREYADRMLTDLDTLEWPEHIKESQRNWIGKSEGAEIDFKINTAVHRKVVILHSFNGNPKDAFYPMLAKKLRAEGCEVVIPDLPHNTEEGVSEAESVKAALEATMYDENTIVIGHSLGAVVALKLVEKLQNKIRKLVLVGGFADPDFKDKRRPFEDLYNWNFDADAIRKNTRDIVLLQDINDTVISKEQANRLGEMLDVSVFSVEAKSNHFGGAEEPSVYKAVSEIVTVFTTRPDTLFGATYLVLAPELTLELALEQGAIANIEEVQAYIEEASKKKEMDRLDATKEKTGVKLEGVTATNPANGEEIPVYVADYVLAGYGTGAIMAVPAHDERDFEFAQKYEIDIKQAVVTCSDDSNNPPSDEYKEVKRDTVIVHLKDKTTGKFALLNWHGTLEGITTAIMGGVEEGQTPREAAIAEIEEEAALSGVKIIKEARWVTAAKYCASHKKENRCAHSYVFIAEIDSLGLQGQISEEEKKIHTLVWVNESEVANRLTPDHQKQVWEMLRYDKALIGGGYLINSGEFDGMDSEEAKKAITEKVGGRMTSTYKIKDWVFSRQRYWGEPIPIIHCEQCGAVPVPEDQLPVTLPEVEHYEPAGDGQSPLATIEEWVNTECPKCGGAGMRETNTMPQWAGSSWYYLRYMDPKNDTELVSKANEKFWAPVDVYVGGDHAVRHLIYARFWHKFLYDIDVVSTVEPFQRLEFLGFILAEDGRKMSKRWGNVINPDDVVSLVGADTLRVYEMFMGPFENTIAWSQDGLAGARRFLERVYGLAEHVSEEPEETTSLLHKTIKKVTDDIEGFKFNTAISAMMIFINQAEKTGIASESYKAFLRILAPFAPHITEELWSAEDFSNSIHTASWPTYDLELAKDKLVTIGVQINGKMRGEITLAPDASEEDAMVLVKKDLILVDKIKEGELKKIIYVPGRILNVILTSK